MAAKKILLQGAITGLIITFGMYLLSVNAGYNSSGGMYFENRFTRAFSVGVIHGYGDRTQPRYEAGLPFQSWYSYDFQGDGCPCDGVSKFSIVFAMILSWGFLFNWLIWSGLSILFLKLQTKYANNRH